MLKARINNMQLNALRRDPVYHAVMVDLYLLGAISKEVAEAITGTEIMDIVKLPDAVVAASTVAQES